VKKIVLGVIAVLGVVVLSFGGVMAVTFSGLKEMADGQELPGGAKRINDGYVSAYLLPTGEKQFALVDCGNDPEAKTIKAELQRRGVGVEAVKAIFLTHGHADHIGGCKQFPGAQVMVGEGDQGLAAGTEGAKGPLPKMMGAATKLGITGARVVKEGEVIEVGTLKARVFLIAGHTGGSAAYLANGALYVGDSLAIQADGMVRPAPWIFSDDGAVNVSSLKRLGKLLAPEAADVKAIVPAHSGSADSLKPLVDYSAS
jgi:glyoxylase-like metal-dependent hydrolase (beta-lactamase superfamily II)